MLLKLISSAYRDNDDSETQWPYQVLTARTLQQVLCFIKEAHEFFHQILIFNPNVEHGPLDF